ncbi:MAG: hypothetical protein ACK4UJ_02775 [Leptonema sp. (in: bacteria)]
MKNLFSVYYYTLFEPEFLSLHLNNLTRRNIYFHRFLVSFFITVSFLLFKETLKIYHIFPVLITIVFFYLFIFLVSKIFHLFFFRNISMIEKFKDKEDYENFIRQSNLIVEFSWFPFVFLVHFSIVANYFKLYVIYILGWAFLIFWHFYILVKGMQHHYEWDLRKTTKEILMSLGMTGFLTLSLIIFFITISLTYFI